MATIHRIGSKDQIPVIIGADNVRSFNQEFGDPKVPFTEDVQSLFHMLPEDFRDIEIWKDLFDVMGEVFDAKVMRYFRDMFGSLDVRYAEEYDTVDRVFLLSEVKQKGMNIDLSAFTENDLMNLYKFITEFWKEKGTQTNFSNFLSFILGFDIKVEQLWTHDYLDFRPKSQTSQPIYEGGIWYPTSHFRLVYDPNRGIDILGDDSPQAYMLRLIYFLAPIQVVLKWASYNYDIVSEPIQIAGSVSVHIEYH